jgi:hypothetical protein
MPSALRPKERKEATITIKLVSFSSSIAFQQAVVHSAFNAYRQTTTKTEGQGLLAGCTNTVITGAARVLNHTPIKSVVLAAVQRLKSASRHAHL